MLSIIYRKYEYTEKFTISKDLEHFIGEKADEDADPEDIKEPIFNPKTFFKNKKVALLKDYKLDEEEAKKEALAVIQLRQQIQDKADKVLKLLSTEEEKKAEIS